MATMNLTIALHRAWDTIAESTHRSLGQDMLTAEQVRKAVKDLLDNQSPHNYKTRRHWMPLSDLQKDQALERAFAVADEPYYMITDDDLGI
jgi:hypothetical protein